MVRQGKPVTFRSGSARDGSDDWELANVATGDLDGDGRDDAVVCFQFTCNSSEDCGNTWGTSVVGFKFVNGKPQWLARLDFIPEGGEVAQTVGIANGKLHIVGDAWAEDDARCCGSLALKATYSYSGGTFVQQERVTTRKP